MKAILALTFTLSASATYLAFSHGEPSQTLVVFNHGVGGTESVVSIEHDLTANECAAKAARIWNAAHAADIAALDAYCVVV